MADARSSTPTQIPSLPGRIADGLRAAIADPRARPGAYIRLRVSGGVRGESYSLDYQIDAAGRESAHLHDQLKSRSTSRSGAGETKADDTARFATLARALGIEALLRTDGTAGGFPPDSVVGRLEVSDGEQTATFLFLADEQQAERARMLAPDALRSAADAVFRAAAHCLDTEDVRP